MISQIVEVAQLAVSIVGFLAVVFLVWRSAIAGVVVALTAFVLFGATPIPLAGDLVFQFGSTSVYPLDVASLALLSVGSFRLLSGRIYGPAKVLLVTLVVLLLGHLIWGATEFGVEQAANHSRIFLPIISGVVFGATVKDWDRRLPTVFIIAGCCLAALSIVRVLQHGLYAANTYIDDGGQLVDARPVIALGVLLMLQALILVLARSPVTMRSVAVAVLLLSGIVLLQYRTVWVAAIACAVLGAFYLAMRYRASNERIVYLFTALALLSVPISLFAISQVSAYEESAKSATGISSTLTWRVEAWKALLGKHSSPFDLVAGTPSGTGREISVKGLETNLSAHNLYVEALLLYGLVGVFAFVALAVLAVRFRDQSARQLEIATPAVLVVILGVALVSMTHTPGQVEGLFFGALLSAACYQTRRSPAWDFYPGRRELAASP